MDAPARFGEIFERHFERIHQYLARRIGASLADELAAQAFVEAFAGRQRFDTRRSDALPWLYGIASNLLRRHRRMEERQLRAYARDGIDPVKSTDLDSMVRRLDAQAESPRLAAALAHLHQPDRDALLLLAWGELSYQEISEALAIPIGTVRSRVHRARRIVRAHLGFRNGDECLPGNHPIGEEI